MPAWLRILLTVSVAAAAVLAVLLWIGARRWDAATAAMRERLIAPRPPGVAVTDFARELERLPAPVARYFHVALEDGQRVVTHARITWAGEFNMGTPGRDRWAPFTAVQDFAPGAPGMLWDARITMSPGLPVRVRDGLVEGVGTMYGAVLGLVPVVTARPSADLTTAALQRYLAELAWLPTALLPGQGVAWTPIDATRALATVTAGGLTTSVEFRFGPTGLIESMYVPSRLFDDGDHPPSTHPWQGRCLGFMTHEGITIPSDAIVEWLLPEGPYAYWRGRPVAVQYDYATTGERAISPSDP